MLRTDASDFDDDDAFVGDICDGNADTAPHPRTPCILNPFNASCSKLLLFERFSTILV